MSYDIVYGSDQWRAWVDVQAHFCREWSNGTGCYGTNPDHGMTWEEAREAAAKWHEEQAAYWRNLKEEEHFQPINLDDDERDAATQGQEKT